MKRAIFQRRLIEWLNRKLAPPGVTIELETPLFAGGLINSIRILDLIAWTEREIGAEIPDRMIVTDNFRSPARIGEVFVKEEAHVVR